MEKEIIRNKIVNRQNSCVSVPYIYVCCSYERKITKNKPKKKKRLVIIF